MLCTVSSGAKINKHCIQVWLNGHKRQLTIILTVGMRSVYAAKTGNIVSRLLCTVGMDYVKSRSGTPCPVLSVSDVTCRIAIMFILLACL